jgi:hypothetical protein
MVSRLVRTGGFVSHPFSRGTHSWSRHPLARRVIPQIEAGPRRRAIGVIDGKGARPTGRPTSLSAGDDRSSAAIASSSR